MKKFIILAMALRRPRAGRVRAALQVRRQGWQDRLLGPPPPNADSKQLNVQTGTSSPTVAPKTALERDKELQKGRDEPAKKDRPKPPRPPRRRTPSVPGGAKDNFAQYAAGGRMQRTNRTASASS